MSHINLIGAVLVRSICRPLTRSGLSWTQSRQMRIFREKTIRAMYWRARSFDAIKLPENRRDQFLEWNYKSEIFAFSRRLQENINETTLRTVLTDPSYIEVIRQKEAKFELPKTNIRSNKVLVESGKKILEDFMKAYLRYEFDQLPEDGITAIANYLGSDEVIADIAFWIGCRDIILTQEYPPNQTTLANSVRALVAGIKEDLGNSRVQRFIVDIFMTYLNDKDVLEDVWKIPYPKETLNRLLANSNLPAYEPRIMFQVGVKTIQSCHVVGVYVNETLIGSSPGETLTIAEECACLVTLQRLFDLSDNRRPLTFGEKTEAIDYENFMSPRDHIDNWKINLNLL